MGVKLKCLVVRASMKISSQRPYISGILNGWTKDG